jgi:8-oxo-dGTP diphosphatase
MAAVVARAVDRARRAAKTAATLVVAMEPHVGRRYDVDAVSAWATGRSMPPADALLAAARVTGLSLDALLKEDEGQDFPDALERLQHLERRVMQLEQALERLQAEPAMTATDGQTSSRAAIAPAPVEAALPDGQQLSVVIAVIAHDGLTLMTRRRFREGTLEWSAPSGEIEPGETPEQAAVREVREEVGLEVTADHYLGERVHPASGRHLVYIACRVVSGNAAIIDHEELAEIAWCTLPEVQDRLKNLKGGLFEPVRIFLQEALSHAKR